ncbi:MAG: deoxyribonuclease IV, partial [bacterium]|nr:deoxyribonuclease IV [bacterium]
MLIGSHLSISKGLGKSVDAANEIGANCFQFFTRNPQGGAARDIGGAEIGRWRELRRGANIFPVIGHLPYTVNLAAQNDSTYEFAQMVVGRDLSRMNDLDAELMVVHPGSRGAQSVEQGIARIVQALTQAFLPFAGTTVLMLEAMAGQGSEIGTIEEIGIIIKQLGSPKNLGLCIDSCHLFSAGYDFRKQAEVERLLDDINTHVGIERLRCVHLNDSKFDVGSHKDRHQLVGKGELGRVGLMNILTHPTLEKLPFILETPVDDYTQYAV